MQIDVVSDTVCPWCYIGKRRLEQALAMRPDVEFDVRWRPYQLDPAVPPEGYDRKAYLAAKFGDAGRLSAMSQAIREHGAGVGLDFAFDRIARTPNTLDSHRLVRWAASVGVQDAVVEALFRAYFIEGRDVGDRPTLVEIAAACGMDAELVEELLGSQADADLVRREVGLAAEMGVSGVPAFVIDNRFLMVGAQDPERLLFAIDKAQSDRGQRSAAT